MNPVYWTLVGDCIEQMRTLADQSVNCVVTSPPYFGLRDYGVDGQIGLEESPEAYVERLVEVFREVRRVLRDDGTLWLNLGDSYAGSGKGGNPDHGKQSTNSGSLGVGCLYGKAVENQEVQRAATRARFRAESASGIKPKDLIGIPWRAVFALQADGWYLRQDIIWHKPNPMPESVKDRCTRAHEYVFLLSKSSRYYYNHEAVKEDAVSTKDSKFIDSGADKQRGHGGRHAGFNGRYAKKLEAEGAPTTRNRRSVWTVSTRPFKGAHFATFPPDLIEPCILAGCPAGGIVLDPFGGSGTTAGVALKHGRNAVLCEINPEYAELVPCRVEKIVNA